MFRVIGIENKIYDFKANGREIYSEGLLFHLAAPLPDGQGEKTESVYLNSRKLSDSYIPVLGENVNVCYNRFGKVERLIKA